MVNTNWDDIENVLYDGTKEEIQRLRCPMCGKEIRYKYSPTADAIEIGCVNGCSVSRGYGGGQPAAVQYFGNECTIRLVR